jgi:hypothetical protein
MFRQINCHPQEVLGSFLITPPEDGSLFAETYVGVVNNLVLVNNLVHLLVLTKTKKKKKTM